MAIVARDIIRHPLMNPQAAMARILQSKGLHRLHLEARTSENLFAQTRFVDHPMLERACAGQICENVSPLRYEGPESLNPLSFKAYNPDREIDGKTLKDHLKLSLAYWHAMRGTGADPFGGGTIERPWDGMFDPLLQGIVRLLGAFELMEKMGAPYWAFHDYDLIDGNGKLRELAPQLDLLTDIAKDRQDATGIKLAWNTNQLFALPIYMEGAATAPDTSPFLRAVGQCQQSIKMGIKLGAENFVFWGGREGYTNLINTMTQTEKQNLAIFLRENIKMARKMGFKGQFLIEPKAFEPTMHQYDRDVSTVLGFLREFGLENEIKINFEPNHGELAGLPAEHELDAAGTMLGSIDINSGRFGIGFDVDEYTNLQTAYHVMRTVRGLRAQGQFQTGVMNIDAKLRRTSSKWPWDLFDGYAKTADLLTAGMMMAIMEERDGRIQAFVQDRYASWAKGIGAEIRGGKWNGKFDELANHVVENEESLVQPIGSGRIEMLENVRDQVTVVGPIVKAFGSGS